MDLIWKSKKIEIVRDVLDAMYACANKEEAQEFKTAYAKVHGMAKAESDLGFLTGEMNDERRHLAYDWFEVFHPIIGICDPTDDEILDAGARLASRRYQSVSES